MKFALSSILCLAIVAIGLSDAKPAIGDSTTLPGDFFGSDAASTPLHKIQASLDTMEEYADALGTIESNLNTLASDASSAAFASALQTLGLGIGKCYADDGVTIIDC
jgi:hypothetical protein